MSRQSDEPSSEFGESGPDWAERLRRLAENFSLPRDRLGAVQESLTARKTATVHIGDAKPLPTLQEISQRIVDATSLFEAMHWHDVMVERLGLEILVLLASDDESTETADALRLVQRMHQRINERLRELIRRGRGVAWP